LGLHPNLPNDRKISMMDLVYVALTVGLFGLSWGLVRLCDRV